MPSQSDVIAAALSLVGTPWQRQGRVPGLGLDCGGVPVMSGRLAGLACPEPPVLDYDGIPSEGRVLSGLSAFADRVGDALSAAQPGDILLMAFGGRASHLGVLTGTAPHRMVHAVARAPHRVTHHTMSMDEQAAVVGVYRYRGLTDG